LRVAFLAGFLMATGISRKDAQAGRHDKPASLPSVGHRQLCRHDRAHRHRPQPLRRTAGREALEHFK
jgi:hypothetical protein